MDGRTVSLKEQWFIDMNTGCYLGRLPVGEKFRYDLDWRVHRSTYVGWRNDHKLVIIRFPAQ
jgi:hypothetical protein